MRRIMLVRGIRGAITVNENTKKEILSGTKELLLTIKKLNDFDIEDIVSIFFSTTPDLNSAFPAAAARELGWSEAPLFGTQEANVHYGLKKCIRILIQINCEKKQNEIKHCYLREAKNLRKDLQ
jgi:chorismate mutase